MKNSLMFAALIGVLTLSACEKTTTVQPVPVPSPSSPPPAVVAVPVTPGPQGAPGKDGKDGKGGDTIVVVPPASNDNDKK